MSSNSSPSSALQNFFESHDPSFIKTLEKDPDTEKYTPNKKSRQVLSGHFVPVEPTPLPKPRLLSYSPAVASLLNIKPEECESEEFLKIFSGDLSPSNGILKGWVTPYALSIYGEQMYHNCPFGNGNGYGDGRAHSIGEFINKETGLRYEIQLKGSGTSPFSRSGDGRAVLRSSVREFLASEAMFYLGCETTRALSLIVSDEELVGRPWYSQEKQQLDINNSKQNQMENISIDDPRLAHVPLAYREALIAQIRERFLSESREPDIMIQTPAAIAVRVAKSFIRVGHVELFARRVVKLKQDPVPKRQLLQLVQHLLQREYSDVDNPSESISYRVTNLLKESSKRIAKLVSNWIRVGYTQGNFNSDNCLVGGRTMDYGPFGFIEKYEPYWNMWTGGGEHFSFMNQGNAADKNFNSFADSVRLLLDESEQTKLQEVIDDFPNVMDYYLSITWKLKLGFKENHPWDGGVSPIYSSLEGLMRRSSVDYTILYRQLAGVPSFIASKVEKNQNLSLDDLSKFVENELENEWIDLIQFSFYNNNLSDGLKKEWIQWLKNWIQVLIRLHYEDNKDNNKNDNNNSSLVNILKSLTVNMKKVSPKYVPREWMLVEAYKSAENNELEPFKTLQKLFLNPYDEQPEFESRFYQKQTEKHAKCGGTAFMTCSS